MVLYLGYCCSLRQVSYSDEDVLEGVRYVVMPSEGNSCAEYGPLRYVVLGGAGAGLGIEG